MVKKLLLVMLTFSVVLSVRAVSFSDTTKNKPKDKTILLWLKQPISLFPILPLRGLSGTFEMDKNGFHFSLDKRMIEYKRFYLVNYNHLYKENIDLKWEDIAKIKRRGSTFLTFFLKDILFIKMKDGKKLFFLCERKKEIIETYKKYMSLR